jgi:hypothetical protein
MKSKIFNACIILSSLVGYLEWGKGYSMFLVQGEIDVLNKLVHDPRSVIHLLTLLPLFGQMVLFFTLFQKTPGKVLTWIGIVFIGVLLLLMSFIGIITMNYKIFLSTLPFMVSSFFALRQQWKKKNILE